MASPRPLTNLRRHLAVLATVVALGAGILAACGGGATGAMTDAAVANRGKAVYDSKCSSCHGGNFQGTSMGPSHLSAIYGADRLSDDQIRAAVLNGVMLPKNWRLGIMSPIKAISDNDITAVIAYIHQQQQQRGLVPYPPPKGTGP